MKVLTYTSYKEHCDLYIYGSIAVSSCQVRLLQKDTILPPEVSIVIYKASKHTGAERF